MKINRRQFMSEIIKIRNSLKIEILNASISNSTSNSYWQNRKNRINDLYDKLEYLWIMYLNNSKDIIETERWKQINIAKKENRRLRRVIFNKDIDQNVINNFNDRYINDFDFTINNSRKPFLLLMRLLELNNKKKEIQAFLEEDEVEQIIREADNYPDARKKIINELVDYANDDKFIILITKKNKEIKFNLKKYAERLLRTVTRQLQTDGVLQAAGEVGSDLVQVSTHNTICPICIEYEGKVYSISGNTSYFPPLLEEPPFHPYPYDKETKVLTKNKGWIEINKVEINDICFSLNKNTNEIEEAIVTKLYKQKKDKMIKFKSKTVDMVVSKDHRMFYVEENKNKRYLISAEKLLNKNKGFFYGGGEWCSNIYIEEEWVKFLAYYLSDGNCTKTKSNNYIISISKLNTNPIYKKIVNCIKNIHNGSIFEYEDRINFNSKEIYDKVKRLGISFDKYVPNEIKKSNKEIIQIFLDTYIECDGYIRTTKLSNYDNGKSYIEKVYYTSSFRMVSDLCECILKIGKKPSYTILHKKGSVAKFKNKESIRNSNVYCIRELNNLYNSVKSIKKEIIDYNDFAYCVELNKNHVLYVSRNGRCVWSGNCLHSLTVTFIETLYQRGIDKYIDFSWGRSDKHPTVKNWIPINKRKIA